MPPVPEIAKSMRYNFRAHVAKNTHVIYLV